MKKYLNKIIYCIILSIVAIFPFFFAAHFLTINWYGYIYWVTYIEFYILFIFTFLLTLLISYNIKQKKYIYYLFFYIIWFIFYSLFLLSINILSHYSSIYNYWTMDLKYELYSLLRSILSDSFYFIAQPFWWILLIIFSYPIIYHDKQNNR